MKYARLTSSTRSAFTAHTKPSQLTAMKNALAISRISTPSCRTAVHIVPSSRRKASHATTNTQDQTMRCAVICSADTLVSPNR
jgi:hypothetical protein